MKTSVIRTFTFITCLLMVTSCFGNVIRQPEETNKVTEATTTCYCKDTLHELSPATEAPPATCDCEDASHKLPVTETQPAPCKCTNAVHVLPVKSDLNVKSTTPKNDDVQDRSKKIKKCKRKETAPIEAQTSQKEVNGDHLVETVKVDETKEKKLFRDEEKTYRELPPLDGEEGECNDAKVVVVVLNEDKRKYDDKSVDDYRKTSDVHLDLVGTKYEDSIGGNGDDELLPKKESEDTNIWNYEAELIPIKESPDIKTYYDPPYMPCKMPFVSSFLC